ncbi:TetR/AcrR family transcriptional regulator [Brachybacterium saurashtrense]|uniref:TetR/AcrR family transcriptional regulator n=1 Tax=Brachybacterium saurashtrense TaxID=556288 RepID=A0A345YT08_9MICO|nr:TetR/AcrR family transcriptional regulator [Brachybacterium saurashtrense]AXK47060.1 TetR/AcrR family transcriptional regulator [Brachybacterium saurashtrense]RRR20909.1 TetR/AcrR family transcriptional regulator [Brachybacterium saurashtrense]
MAWDTEATRRKLLDAGTRQFAAHGFSGARMETIGRDAGVNKERIYRYFGDKEAFFAAVLERELSTMLDEIAVTTSGPDALGEFAGQLFDRCAARPELPRLLAWESLELDHAVAVEQRRPLCADYARRLRDALPGLDRHDAGDLLLTAITLVVGCWTLGNVAESVLPTHRAPADRRERVITELNALAKGLLLPDDGAAAPHPR